jgi:hypothetical protein
VDIVVNYFNPGLQPRLFYQTLHCLACLSENENTMMVLCDGSGFEDKRLSALSGINNFIYLYSERQLTFPEGYNLGIDYCIGNSSSEYICLCANDIFPNRESLSKMLDAMKANTEVGCVIPYLDNSDLPIQRDRYLKRKRYCKLMTLNMNLFRKTDLEKIGKVPLYLSGCFNDFVMAHKLNKLGKKIVLCDGGKIFHLQRQTQSFQSKVSFDVDKTTFIQHHPDLAPTNPYLIMRYSPFARNRYSKVYYTILDRCRSSLATRLLLKVPLIYYRTEKSGFFVAHAWYRRLLKVSILSSFLHRIRDWIIRVWIK